METWNMLPAKTTPSLEKSEVRGIRLDVGWPSGGDEAAQP
jgi:hypothetical protein